MRQVTVEEAIQQGMGEAEGPEVAGGVEAEEPREPSPPWYLAESPDVPVEEYIHHPLNWAESRGLARALRGAEGLVGSLRYAVLDLVVGVAEFVLKEAGGGDGEA